MSLVFSKFVTMPLHCVFTQQEAREKLSHHFESIYLVYFSNKITNHYSETKVAMMPNREQAY